MRSSAWTWSLAVDAATGLVLGLSYVLAFLGCARPLSCWFGGGCVTVCVDPWTQFPTVAGIGFGLGAVPAALVYLAVRAREGPSSGR